MAPIVPTPAPVPPRPLTLATELVGKMSAGRLRMIVEKAAYANVEIAKQATIAENDDVHTTGTSSVMPRPPITAMHLRAAPTLQPRVISQLETPPPKKFPRSAARNGTQNPARLSSSLNPRDTRYTANQSVMKNQTGSVNA